VALEKPRAKPSRLPSERPRRIVSLGWLARCWSDLDCVRPGLWQHADGPESTLPPITSIQPSTVRGNDNADSALSMNSDVS